MTAEQAGQTKLAAIKEFKKDSRMNASQANPQPSRRMPSVSVVNILSFLSPANAQSANVSVPVPNGNLNISATDLS
ncbi:hypothetical protein FACS189441_8010 [Betaproteobacteria bacterium]|nr:hypothetical protein FACS189441_8010 [Betaproteobacteria bacterium]